MSQKCDRCNQEITGGQKFTKALGRVYHVEHFACAKCNTPLNSATPFYDVGSQPVCASCEKDTDIQRCDVCLGYISGGETVHALNKQYHILCFTCAKCGVKLDPDGRLFAKDDKPSCEKCFGRSSSDYRVATDHL